VDMQGHYAARITFREGWKFEGPVLSLRAIAGTITNVVVTLLAWTDSPHGRFQKHGH